MQVRQIRTWVYAFVLVLVLTLAACGSRQQPSRWDQAQQASSTQEQAPADDALPGSTFNQLFPREAAQTEGFNFTYTQEKAGFAEAALSREGTQVALLSISDTVTNPDAVEKYQDRSNTIAGYPAYEDEQVTAILVADRFQVQVFSETDSFTASDRETWLQHFDLDGLAALIPI
jgi:hypothetical protein